MTDVPTTNDGLFEIRGVECGNYLLIAMSPSGLLGTMVTKTYIRAPSRHEASGKVVRGRR